MSNIDESGVNSQSPEEIDAWVAVQTELADVALEEQLRNGSPFWMALEPEFYGQDPTQVDQIFAEVPDDDLQWVDIRFMQKVLFRDGEFYGQGLQSIDHLLFNET